MRTKTNKTPAPTAAPNVVGTATFTKPATVAKADRRRKSEVENPVGVTWAECLNRTAANGGTPPARKELHAAVYEMGVAYATVRTQVDRYLRWFRNGADRAALPKGVAVSE